MSGNFSRREFLKHTGISGVAAVAGGCATRYGLGEMSRAQAAESGTSLPHAASIFGRKAYLPPPKGERVIVVGGGWSGLTMAKYLKREKPDFDVVMIERRKTFVSSPISNTFYAGVVEWEFLCHSYHDAARHNGYLFFNATVVDVDRDQRRVFTDQGYVDYDWLVLAPGIEYNYPSLGVEDPAEEHALRDSFPGGFLPGSEDLTLKHKVEGFEGGTFLLTCPGGNYRCLPAPYERACMIANAFQQNKVKGKVVLLDENPEPTIKKEGFLGAFEELYGDIIEYHPSARITGVDPHNKRVETEFGGLQFDDAAIYPRIRGGLLLEYLGLTRPKTQMEADIDPLKYNVQGDMRVYVTGDSRPMPFSKSGNTSNSEAKYVAKVIAARSEGREIDWRSPTTICYSMVNADPNEAIMVDTLYSYTKAGGRYEWSFAETKMDQEWDRAKGYATLEWARGMYRDLFTDA